MVQKKIKRSSEFISRSLENVPGKLLLFFLTAAFFLIAVIQINLSQKDFFTSLLASSLYLFLAIPILIILIFYVLRLFFGLVSVGLSVKFEFSKPWQVWMSFIHLMFYYSGPTTLFIASNIVDNQFSQSDLVIKNTAVLFILIFLFLLRYSNKIKSTKLQPELFGFILGFIFLSLYYSILKQSKYPQSVLASNDFALICLFIIFDIVVFETRLRKYLSNILQWGQEKKKSIE